MLRHVLAPEKVIDFQDWQPWRGLVVATATQVLDLQPPQIAKLIAADAERADARR
jgi:hypothetical protein